MGAVAKDPYKVVMNPTKLPITLLQEKAKYARVHMLDTEPFEKCFGSKATRKKPKLLGSDMESLVKSAEAKGEAYNEEGDKDRVRKRKCSIMISISKTFPILDMILFILETAI